MRIWRTLVGVAWLGVAAWVAATRYGVLVAGHPAYGIAVVVAGLVGLGFLVTAWAASSSRIRFRIARVIGSVVAGILTVVGVGTLVFLRPFPASDGAVEAMRGSRDVDVDNNATTITLEPRQPIARSTTAMVFQPGARVDPRAYVPMLSDVAAQGYLVVIVKQPFGLGFSATNAPAEVIEEHPEVEEWMLAGHSLGGVVASSYAAGDRAVRGLVLWASYPDNTVPDRVVATSIFGTEDAFTTPDDVEASREDLPASTTLVPVEGAVHAFFGDYGEQPGDGTPTVDRAQAQAAIVTATVQALGAAPRPRQQNGS